MAKRGRLRWRDYLTALAVLAAAALLAAIFSDYGAHSYRGPFHAVDGDSLKRGETRFRLIGIDAPEYRQTCGEPGEEWPCGRRARGVLDQMTASREAVCESDGVDRYDRILARCRRGELDINREMVARGLAIANGAFYRAERAARRDGLGIWAGSFEVPAEWRAANRPAEAVERGDWLEWLMARIRMWVSTIKDADDAAL